jgi:hypothetical protein
VLAAGSVMMREFRTLSGVAPVMAREAPVPLAAAPAGVPARAISVPVLLFSGGKDVRVGETLSEVDHLLGPAAEAQPQSVERGPTGNRVTRYYDRQGTRFELVFEPFERNAEPRVAAIYLH